MGAIPMKRYCVDVLMMRAELAMLIEKISAFQSFNFLLHSFPPRAYAKVMYSELPSAVLQESNTSVLCWTGRFDETRLEKYQFEGIERGILSIRFPRVFENCLEPGTVALTLDNNNGTEFESNKRAGQALFQAIRQEMKHYLMKPVLDLEGRVLSNFLYSAGAVQWVRNGGTFSGHCGRANQEYRLPEPIT